LFSPSRKTPPELSDAAFAKTPTEFTSENYESTDERELEAACQHNIRFKHSPELQPEFLRHEKATGTIVRTYQSVEGSKNTQAFTVKDVMKTGDEQ